MNNSVTEVRKGRDLWASAIHSPTEDSFLYSNLSEMFRCVLILAF